jgi:hypothetical protein
VQSSIEVQKFSLERKNLELKKRVEELGGAVDNEKSGNSETTGAQRLSVDKLLDRVT